MMYELIETLRRCPEFLLLALPAVLMFVFPIDTKTSVPCDGFRDIPF